MIKEHMQNSLSEILDNIEVLVYVADFKTYEILYVNKYARTLFGDIRGKICWQSLQAEQDGPCSFCTNDKIITAEGRPTGVYHWEFQNTVTGRWFDIRDSAIAWHDGRMVRLEVATDITKRKAAEEELHRYEHIVANSTDMMALLDKKFVYLAANKAYLKAFDLTPDKLIGYSAVDVFGKVFFETVIKPNAQRCLSGEHVNYQSWFEFPASQPKYMDINYYPYLGPDDMVKGIVVNGRDITERKQTDERLKESESKLSEAQKIAQLGHYVFDIKTSMWRNSDELDDIFGIDENYKRDVNGWLHIIHPDYRETMLNYLQENVLTQHQKFDKEYKIINCKSGQERWVHGLGYLKFGNSSDPLEMVGTIQDITERKQQEIERELLHKELKQKNRELEQIVYITSHDLRAPLVNIDGYSREVGRLLKELFTILERDEISAEVKEKVDLIVKKNIAIAENHISTSVSKMNALLSGLLQISRIGRFEINKEKLDMNEIISDIVDTVKYQVEKAGAKVEISELPSCTGDNNLINQLFSNIIENALKYLDPERPGIIRFSGRTENGSSVYCIEDNGIGIPPDHKEKIFEIFYQLKPKQSAGEGLGLTIVMKVINIHHGKIWVESEPGTGSKFYVSLPNG